MTIITIVDAIILKFLRTHAGKLEEAFRIKLEGRLKPEGKKLIDNPGKDW